MLIIHVSIIIDFGNWSQNCQTPKLKSLPNILRILIVHSVVCIATEESLLCVYFYPGILWYIMGSWHGWRNSCELHTFCWPFVNVFWWNLSSDAHLDTSMTDVNVFLLMDFIWGVSGLANVFLCTNFQLHGTWLVL